MLIKDTMFMVVDTETTGLDSEKDRIVELAVVRCDVEGVGFSNCCMFNPGIPIPPSASAIHHIIDQDVANLGEYSPAYFLNPTQLIDVFAAHNAAFDKSFLKIDAPFICTMRLAQKLWPDLESYSNQFLRYSLGLCKDMDRSLPMHRALPDAIVTAHLLVHELKEVLSKPAYQGEFEPTVEELIDWIEKPILLIKVRFGKHKDSLWSEVPKDYLRWAANNMKDLDRDTEFTIAHYLKA